MEREAYVKEWEEEVCSSTYSLYLKKNFDYTTKTELDKGFELVTCMVTGKDFAH